MCLVAFTGWQAIKAKEALELVAANYRTLGEQLTTGDQRGARSTLTSAQRHADVAEANTDGPGWWLTSRLPGVGPNIDAVRTAAGATQVLSSEVLPAVVRATRVLRPDQLRPTDGRVDLGPLQRIAADVVAADRRLQRQAARVAAVRTGRLAPQIGIPLRRMQRELAHAAMLSDRASRAVRLLPSMLGAHGPRSYLVLFQNNAELRSTGGIPGSFAVLHADRGRIRLGEQGDAGSIGYFPRPPVELTSDERALFGLNLGRYPQDVNFTPDFPRSAELIRAMWNARRGLQVDGVVSTDPVALSYLLQGTGPVPLPAGDQLTAENAVRTLLSDVYDELPDPESQDAFFATVAGRVFEALVSGQGEPAEVLRGLTRGAEERRILVWSSVPDEQRLIAPTRLSGQLVQEATPAPRIGVFLNDGTAAKMGYYLRHRVSVRPLRCQGDRQVLQVDLVLRSTAPPDGAGLSSYVTGTLPGIPKGTARTGVLVYAPVGGYVDQVEVDGEPREPSRQTHGERSLVETTVDVAPGETRRLGFTVYAGEDQDERPVLRVTPGSHGSGVGEVGPAACS